MALAQYSDTFWFPTGVLAASVPARIFPEGSNGLAPLWGDAAGTVALMNPLNTSPAGVLTFFATVGRYWVHLDTETFLIDVGMSQEQADLSTGIASGGNLEINGLNDDAVDIAALIGYVVDNTQTGTGLPSVIRVDAPAQTVVLDGPAQARPITWLLMDSAGVVTQQAPSPSNTQRRTHIALGAVVYDTVAGAILEVQTLPIILPQAANQVADLMDGLGPFSQSGNRITPNGADMSFSKSAGILFARAFHHYVGTSPTEDPHVSISPAHTPAQFRRITQTATAATPPVVTTIDAANFDVGGVITPVGGGANSATIQRVWLFATSLSANQILVQYGQVVYSSLANAVAAIASGVFVPAPISASGALIGYIAVIRTATNLSDPTQATFVNAGKFATP